MGLAYLPQPRSLIVPRRGLRQPNNPILDPTHPLSKGLVGCWLFNKIPANNANYAGAIACEDISIYGNPCTYNSFDNQTNIIDSHHGGTSYNNTDINHQLRAAAGSQYNSNLFSVTGWVKLPSGGLSAGGAVISKRQIGLCFALRNAATATWQFYTQTGALVFATGGTAVVGWQFVAGTYDGVNNRVYVNGALGATAAQTGTVANQTSRVCFGGGDLEAATGGSIEGCRYYNRVLSAAEIAWLFAEPYAGILDQAPRWRVGKASGGVSINLTGIFALGAVGLTNDEIDYPPGGIAGTGALAITPQISLSPSGTFGSGIIANFTPAISLLLSSVAGAGQTNLTQSPSPTGLFGLGTLGQPVYSLSYAPSGVFGSGRLASGTLQIIPPLNPVFGSGVTALAPSASPGGSSGQGVLANLSFEIDRAISISAVATGLAANLVGAPQISPTISAVFGIAFTALAPTTSPSGTPGQGIASTLSFEVDKPISASAISLGFVSNPFFEVDAHLLTAPSTGALGAPFIPQGGQGNPTGVFGTGIIGQLQVTITAKLVRCVILPAGRYFVN